MFETLYKACKNNDAFSDRAQKSHVLARKSLAKVMRRLFLPVRNVFNRGGCDNCKVWDYNIKNKLLNNISGVFGSIMSVVNVGTHNHVTCSPCKRAYVTVASTT